MMPAMGAPGKPAPGTQLISDGVGQSSLAAPQDPRAWGGWHRDSVGLCPQPLHWQRMHKALPTEISLEVRSNQPTPDGTQFWDSVCSWSLVAAMAG